MTGLLVLNKPGGITSRDAVNRVVRVLGRRTRVGHAGTLDPLATGVLVLAVGSATRLIEYVQRMAKTYRATIRLGAWSDTDDADGQITSMDAASIPSMSDLLAALPGFLGTIQQLPPRYSALKLNGRRAYDLARQGQSVELAPRAVRIDRISLERYEWPEVVLEVECGAGTYIRSLARDLGEGLGCGGYITGLERTRIGQFTLERAFDPDGLSLEAIKAGLLPAATAVSELTPVQLTPEMWEEVAHGRSISARLSSSPLEGKGELALFGPKSFQLAIAEYDPATLLIQPRRVLG